MLGGMTRRRHRSGLETVRRAGRPTLPFPSRPLHPLLGEADRQAPVTVEELCARWRLALFSAQDALAAARACGSSLHFDAHVLSELTRRLALEPSATDRLLESVAHQDHIPLHYRLGAPRATNRMLGLPPGTAACLFDLDGVLTGSAEIHAAAWRDTFDEFLSSRLERTGERFAPFRPFSRRYDYYRHIHGKPRLAGAHAFLASRGIRLPEGTPGDPPDAETVYGLCNRKNEAFGRRLEREGVGALAGSLRYLEAAHEAGVRCAVLSASANTEAILRRSGLAYLVDAIVDGNVIRREGLESKPAPDTIITACQLLGVTPAQAAAFETTTAGVEASRSAGVALTVAIDSMGHADALRHHGADVIVPDLTGLLDPALAG